MSISGNNISENVMALIQKEIRKNTNLMSVREKEKRGKLKGVGLVKHIQHNFFAIHPLLTPISQKELRKLDENDTMEWLRLGLDISDDLNNFRVNGKTITQMSIRDLKEHMSMESALKVTKAVIKASGRDMQEFGNDYTDVMRASDVLPSVEGIFKAEQMSAESVDESIISVFGDGFSDTLKDIKDKLEEGEWIETQKRFKLTDDEMLVYASLLECSDGKKGWSRKIFEPFVSRIPAAFLKSGDFFVRALSVLRKLPTIERRSYDVKTKGSVEEFGVGESYVFPSFAVGTKFNEDEEGRGENGITLRFKGKTKRGHALKNEYWSGNGSLCSLISIRFLFVCFRNDYPRA